MKKILIVTTLYRVGERIFPTIPTLSENYELDVLLLYQMNPSYKWTGDNDLRKQFHTQYDKYFTNQYTDVKQLNYNEYDLIVCDDNRNRNGLDVIYNNKKCNVVACSHGNTNQNYQDIFHKKCFDYAFVFGEQEQNEHSFGVGIPSNDKLKHYHKRHKHILLIVNFLGNRSAPFKVKFDKDFIDKCGILDVQKIHNEPIIVKLKSRKDEGSYKNNISYIDSIFPSGTDYKILIDVEDDNELIADSMVVFSAPSTMAFKPIQMGIPTVLIDGSGQTGLFKNYKGLLPLDKQTILDYINTQQDNTEFINNTLSGGNTFTATDVFINQINKLIT